MKIAIAQLNYHIGNFESNTEKIRQSIKRARDIGADLVVFAELAISGYPPRDFLEFDDFIRRCERSIETIAKDCTDIAAIVGAPSVNPEVEGKHLFNSAFYLADGRIKTVYHKGLLPTYDVFDEYRYFEPGKKFEVIECKGCRIALTVCEDIWDIEEDLMYTITPMDELAKQSPDIMINISASPFDYSHADARKRVLHRNIEKYNLPAIYVNHIGAQTELIFDGGSLAMNRNRELALEMKYFEEDFRVLKLEEGELEEGREEKGEESWEMGIGSAEHAENGKIGRIHDALVLGIREYFRKLGFGKAILGLSGGIDSAVVMVLAERALGKENVRAVLMPSQFSSEHSVKDAVQLANTLGAQYDIIDIRVIYKRFMHELKPVFSDLPFDLTEENLQARIRGTLVMGLSNKYGYILLNTSNKSELAVGYGTLYGDMCGGLSVIGDVYKTEVYQLAGYINREEEVIPGNIIRKPPSAELRPDQMDTDSLPEYDILDRILMEYIENRQGPNEIIDMGFDEGLVRRILRMVNMNEYKRHQTPPILRVSPKAFGMGRRMPIVGKYLA